MIYSTLGLMMLIISLFFVKSKHPLSMGSMLILQTITISLYVGQTKSFMFSYILMMVMLSGMLVLFMYMTSVASNEKFTHKVYNLPISVLTSTLLLMSKDPIISNMATSQQSMNMMYDPVSSMLKIFSNQNMPVVIMLVMYLFYTMIVISSIVCIHEGPMRSKS